MAKRKRGNRMWAAAPAGLPAALLVRGPRLSGADWPLDGDGGVGSAVVGSTMSCASMGRGALLRARPKGCGRARGPGALTRCDSRTGYRAGIATVSSGPPTRSRAAPGRGRNCLGVTRPVASTSMRDVLAVVAPRDISSRPHFRHIVRLSLLASHMCSRSWRRLLLLLGQQVFSMRCSMAL